MGIDYYWGAIAAMGWIGFFVSSTAYFKVEQKHNDLEYSMTLLRRDMNNKEVEIRHLRQDLSAIKPKRK